MTNQFKNKTILVTGAASGMGKAMVKKLVDKGARVYACDWNENGLAEFLESSNISVIKLDVSSSSACNAVAEQIVKERGRLDGMVNFAGVIKRTGILDCTDEDFDYVMKVNVYGTFYLTRAIAQVMLRQGSGSIVNVSSVWSTIGASGVLAYCTSKGAVSQLTRSSALDLAGTGVRINEIRPGETNTAMLASERKGTFTKEDIAKKLKEIAVSIPEKRLADPEEMANAALFLLSDESSYIQGSSITVDGGYSAQ
ncbi:SDR family oxidoreductase [Galbibacter sp. PAP.153]|uniref:SDR family NAD(P)-dependent oxidoreductase n=1 Tax=Galbibacter sp. PAP.153 TaxID=3104623 RepID=UPI003009B246